MTRRWFGTDGIRGPVGRLPMTPEFVLRLGQAAGKVLMASQAEIGSTRNGRKP
ncbi:MAG: phosphoglucosamine mutase, partial [Betaproteobacteria bacterium]|nr:phosphoglucosamine mutase [Betaproteobacteria bacterium]